MGDSTETALVVLGAAVWPNNQPSPSLRRRATHAAALFVEGIGQIVVCSGGVGKHPPSEAEVIRQLLLANGVPDNAILLESKSHTTLQNVLFCARILRRRSVSQVIVVSDKYHLLRAVMCFRSLGFRATGSGSPRDNSETPMGRWIYYHLRELLALALYTTKIRELKARFRNAAEE